MSNVVFSKGDDDTPAALVIDTYGKYGVYKNGVLLFTAEGMAKDVDEVVLSYARERHPGVHIGCFTDVVYMGYQVVYAGESDSE